MAMSVQELAARRTRRAAERLLRIARETPAGKEDWSPLQGGRTILDHLANASVANLRWSRLIGPERSPSLGQEEEEEILSGARTLEGACARLASTAEQLAAVILETPDDALGEGFSAPWWEEGEEVPLALAFGEAPANMAFCHGQIFEIQKFAGIRPADPPLLR